MDNIKLQGQLNRLSFEYFSTISPVSFADNNQEITACIDEETLFSIDAGYPSENVGRFFEATKIASKK